MKYIILMKGVRMESLYWFTDFVKLLSEGRGGLSLGASGI